jgi:hypothetical protein
MATVYEHGFARQPEANVSAGAAARKGEVVGGIHGNSHLMW